MSAGTKIINFKMSYDVNQQRPQSVLLPLNIRFNYGYETLIGDVQRGLRTVVIDSVSPYFQCQIDTLLVAHHQHPANFLCNYLQDFLSWCNRSLDYTSRLKLAQGIAGSLEHKLRLFFPLQYQVTVEVQIIKQRTRHMIGTTTAHSRVHHRHQHQHRMLDGDTLILDGDNIVESERRYIGTAHSRVHRSLQHQRMLDGDTLILDGGNIVESERRDHPHSRIHRQQQRYRMIDGDVLIFDGGNVESDGGGSGTGTRVSRSALNKLMKDGSFHYHNVGGEGEKAKEECSICWETYIDGIEAIKMPCFHVFHEKCIVRWLTTKNSCPLCRQTV